MKNYVVLGGKILLVAVIGGVAAYVWYGNFWSGFFILGILNAVVYIIRNRKRIL